MMDETLQPLIGRWLLGILEPVTRILMRAGKSPFSSLAPYKTFDENVIGNNNGNLLFSSAAHKLLSADDVEVKAHGFNFSAAQAPKVSSEFDKFVLPLANAFRVGFEPQLKRITQFIEKLDIPTVMLSGGGTIRLGRNIRALGTHRRFGKSVLPGSPQKLFAHHRTGTPNGRLYSRARV